MILVNVGCGGKYVKESEWINIDFNTNSKYVMEWNILKGLPFEDESVDAIYSSCMLEHLSKEEAESLIKECYRCLKINGILRIVVPDLENVCREYLNQLQICKEDNSKENQLKYEYVLIELLDQMTRRQSGGEMLKYWIRQDRDEEYIVKRTGHQESTYDESIKEIRKKMSLNVFFRKAIRKINRILFGKTDFYRKWSLGEFMCSGEVHRWMYDEMSLTILFQNAGFGNIMRKNYNVSEIINWKDYGLEISHDGNEYKPNCIYMEGRKGV